MTTRERPLSPHLGIYRWQYSNFLSILNRATGVLLSLGLPLLVYGLVAIASGPRSYQNARDFFDHPLVTVLMIGWSASFFFHLLNGIRHLLWDMGYGLERATARASGWTVFIGALVLTLLCWIAIMARFNGVEGGLV